MKNRLRKYTQSFGDVTQMFYENHKGQYHGFYQFFNLYDDVENKHEGCYFRDITLGIWKECAGSRIRRLNSLKDDQKHGISIVFSVSK